MASNDSGAPGDTAAFGDGRIRDGLGLTADASRPITGIVYREGAAFEAFIDALVEDLVRRNVSLAGLVQHSVPRPGRRRCDMMLRDLATGFLHPISEDRGAEARGCTLDTDLLLRACTVAHSGLTVRTALVVLSKFGKVECENAGLCSLIEAAIERAVPVLIGVPAINLEPFRAFAGDFAGIVSFEEIGADFAEALLAHDALLAHEAG